ncbi:hypothetical protein LLEC1_03160 [Akanthomyces lecanii]|uniref:Uncharacterized protein n=1 Tax=Cordyceps confragosa TaxID=2714763 RepID=A0A179I3H4_CORDF|nr:hypothetical protein LLEC1_03160 [Akanthomyces lecanii]
MTTTIIIGSQWGDDRLPGYQKRFASLLKYDVEDEIELFKDSSTGLGGTISGLGLGIRDVKEAIGVIKAYTTRLGLGGLPTEDSGEIGKNLQDFGRESAAVIRCKLRWASHIEIRKPEKRYPRSQQITLLERVETVCDELSGWNTSIAKMREWSKLPKEAHDYIEYIKRFVGTKASTIPATDRGYCCSLAMIDCYVLHDDTGC